MIAVIGESGSVEFLASGGSQNFLLPNGTFFFELILFGVVFFLISRYIVPPIREALAARSERVRQTQADRDEAERKRAETDRRRHEILSEARSSATSIREEARASARSTVEQRRTEAEEQVAQRRSEGESALAEERSRVWSDLEGRMPELSTTLAERILGRRLSEDTGTVHEPGGSPSRIPTGHSGSSHSGAEES